MYFLEDETIGLRNPSADDIKKDDGYRDWFNDAEVCRYNSHHRFPMTCQKLYDYVESCNRDISSMVFAVELKSSGTHIGNISLQQIDLINRQAEIAFIFGKKEMWGKGYAFKAAKMLINHAFLELGLNRIYFGTADNNIPMQKLGEKLSFQCVGRFRQALFKHGEYRDILEFDLLKCEWLKEN